MTKIDGWLGDFLKIRVTAQPEKGRANDAVVALLAHALSVQKKNVTVSSGASSPKKVIDISGLSDSEVRARLPGERA